MELVTNLRLYRVPAAVTYDVIASDPDGDALTYSLLDPLPGMAIDPISGVITWEPQTFPTGPFGVTVQVSDGLNLTTVQIPFQVFD